MVAATEVSSSSRRRPTVRSRLTTAVTLRPPILLEFSSLVVKAGNAGNVQPEHVLALPQDAALFKGTTDSSKYYRLYASVLQSALNLLGQDTRERRVIILYLGLYCCRAWEEAIRRILIDLGAPVCNFVPSLWFIPRAIPMIPTMLIVQVTLTEAHCMVFSEGHPLQFTYQNVNRKWMKNKKEPFLSSVRENESKLLDFLSFPTGSLALGILLCLESSPINLRKAAIQNMIVVGEVVDPSFVLNLVVLMQKSLHAGSVDDLAEIDSSAVSAIEPGDSSSVITLLPVKLSGVMPLSDQVGCISNSVAGPAILAWLGTSIWASKLHSLDPDSDQFRWIRPPSVAKPESLK